MEKVTLQERGNQPGNYFVTVPQKICDGLGWKKGTVLEVDLMGEWVVLRKDQLVKRKSKGKRAGAAG